MAEDRPPPAPNSEANAERKRQINLENLARAREILRLKKEKEKAAKEEVIVEKPPVNPEPEPYIIESNKESEEEPRRFFWAEPKFRAFRKRLREEMEEPPIPPPEPVVEAIVEEPPQKIQKTEEGFWDRIKNGFSHHASGAGKVFIASFFVLIAQTMAKKAHQNVENHLPMVSNPFISQSRSKYLNPVYAEY